MKLPRHNIISASSALVLAMATQQAYSSGFSLFENSASGMGTAFAGAAATAEDATTTYFNPAGLTHLKNTQLVVAGHIISTSADFTNTGTSVNPLLTGGATLPIQGSNDDGGQTAFVPNFYLATPITDDLVFGLGVSVPFGLETNYDDNWVGRYHALKSAVKTINVNPSLGYQVNDQLSIGGGVSIQYVKAELSQAIDSTAVCLGLVGQGAVSMANCAAVGLTPDLLGSGTVDSRASLKADDISYGFNLGLLYEFNQDTRLGLAYRSSIKQNTTGDADFTVNPGLAALLTPVNAQLALVDRALLVDSPITASVEVPALLSLSIAHQLSPTLQLLGDITRTSWSTFDELRIQYDSGQSDSVTTESWDDVTRYSIGLNYQHSDKLTLRTGVAYDEEAIPDTAHRTPRIPGNDRTWLTFGLGYDLNQSAHIDVGYAHLFIDDTTSTHVDENTGYAFNGVYKGDANILSVQLNWNY